MSKVPFDCCMSYSWLQFQNTQRRNTYPGTLRQQARLINCLALRLSVMNELTSPKKNNNAHIDEYSSICSFYNSSQLNLLGRKTENTLF
jgi:hypothetical protein